MEKTIEIPEGYEARIEGNKVIFELQESEDERIRKWIIDDIRYNMNNEPLNNSEYKKNAEKAIAWLEKRGEQKPTDKVEPKFKVGDTIINIHYRWGGNSRIREITDSKYIFDDGSYIVIREQDNWELVEQKSADKAEPKFRNGQWIVWQNKCYKVNYNSCGYELVDQNGLSTSLEYETVEESAHLWDITKDAKDGDVLTCPLLKDYESGEQIFIFKSINSRDYVDDCIEYYCRVCEGVFYENKNGYMGTTSSLLYPATKEQRDLLFRKMKEAGYEWNAEKKELRKVEPNFHEGDWIISNTVNKDYHICKITGIKDGNYIIESTCGYKGYNSFETFEKDYHIWTIQNAQDGDGDVLVASDDSIFLFKCVFDTACKHYVALTTDNVVKFNKNLVHCWESSRAVHPATKEQRDKLLKAIANAGYTFDFEKKELKKIEKNPIPMSLDEAIKHCEEKSCGNNTCALEHKQLEKWLIELKELKEQKPTWSEEDEKMLEMIISDYTVASKSFCGHQGKLEWLKSLKDKMQP